MMMVAIVKGLNQRASTTHLQQGEDVFEAHRIAVFERQALQIQQRGSAAGGVAAQVGSINQRIDAVAAGKDACGMDGRRRRGAEGRGHAAHALQ